MAVASFKSAAVAGCLYGIFPHPFWSIQTAHKGDRIMNHFIGRAVAGALLAVSTTAWSAHAQAVINPNSANQNNQDQKQRTEQGDKNKKQGPANDRGASDRGGPQGPTSPSQPRDMQQVPRAPSNPPSPLNPNMQNIPAQTNPNAPTPQGSTVLPGERFPRALSNPQLPANLQSGQQPGNDRSMSNQNNQNQNNRYLSNRPYSQSSSAGNRVARRESMTDHQYTAMRPNDLRAPDIGLWFNRSTIDGLVVADVSTRGPIARLGFHEGDRIISVGGRLVTSEPEFMDFLLGSNTDRVEVVVLRDGRRDAILVEPATLTQDYGYTEVDPVEQFGIVLDNRYDNRIVVWRVIRRSPAYYAGLREGDVISSLSGRLYNSRRDFETSVRGLRAGETNLQVRRGDRNRDLTVDVPEYEKGARNDNLRGDDRINTDRNNQGNRDQGARNQGNRDQGNQRDNNDRSNNDRSGNDRNNNPQPGNQSPAEPEL
jgi:hypothetical protein